MGDLLYQCLSSTSTERLFCFFFNIICPSFFSYPSTLLDFSSPCTVYNTFTAEVKLEVYHRIPQIHSSLDSRCMNKPGISQDTKQMAKPHSVSTFPPPGNLRDSLWSNETRDIADTFLLYLCCFFADCLLLLKWGFENRLSGPLKYISSNSWINYPENVIVKLVDSVIFGGLFC